MLFKFQLTFLLILSFLAGLWKLFFFGKTLCVTSLDLKERDCMVERSNSVSFYWCKNLNRKIDVGQDSLDLEEIHMTLQNCFLSLGRLYRGRTETFSKC